MVDTFSFFPHFTTGQIVYRNEELNKLEKKGRSL